MKEGLSSSRRLRGIVAILCSSILLCVLTAHAEQQQADTDGHHITFEEHAVGTFLFGMEYFNEGLMISGQIGASQFSSSNKVLAFSDSEYSVEYAFMNSGSAGVIDSAHSVSIDIEIGAPSKCVQIKWFALEGMEKKELGCRILPGNTQYTIYLTGSNIWSFSISGYDSELGKPDGLGTVALDNIRYTLSEPTIYSIDSNYILSSAMKGNLPDFINFNPKEHKRVIGAAADGVTRVLLVKKTGSSGNVRFSLDNLGKGSTGKLAALGSEKFSDSITVPAVPTKKGAMAFAVYKAPMDFNPNNDDWLKEKKERSIRITSEFISQSLPSHISSSFDFTIVRPPVVFMHGLWSNAATWMNFPLRTSNKYLSKVVADYSGSAASSFSSNVKFCKQATENALLKIRSKSIAATQVDIVGHSMGGILSREFARSSKYFSVFNYNKGYFHKIITLNTPHLGSPLATYLYDYVSWLSPVSYAFKAIGMPIDQGAIADLSLLDTNRKVLTEVKIPSHAIVGTGANDVCGIILNVLKTLRISILAEWHPLFMPFSAFSGILHDGIVGYASQEGGINSMASSEMGGPDSVHMSVTSSERYSDLVDTLLDYPTSSRLFGYFPNTLTSRSTPQTQTSFSMLNKGLVSPQVTTGLSLNGVMNGDNFEAGKDIVLSVDVDSGTAVKKVSLFTSAGCYVDETEPFQFEINTPKNLTGVFNVFAVAEGEDQTLVQSDFLTLEANVPSNALLHSIESFQDEIVFAKENQNRAIILIGHYNDGIKRNISSPKTGTSYLSSDIKVATVSPDGVVTSVGDGVAIITIKNGSKVARIPVTVDKSLDFTSNRKANLAPVMLLLLD